jgi:hypothetical protein
LDTVSIKSTRDPVAMRMFPALSNQAIARLRLIGIALISASLVWQLLQLRQQHGGHVSTEPAANTRQISPAAASPIALAQLFAQPASSLPSAQVNSTLQLLACFTAVDSRQSSALLAIDGQAARRVHTGQQIVPGVRLVAIQAQSIEIASNGHTYRLRLGRNTPIGQPVGAFNSFARPLISSIARTE